MGYNIENNARLANSLETIRDAYNHRNRRIPFQIFTTSYWVSGETPSRIPKDYFTNPASMLRYQLNKIEQHMERFDDDYIPFLFPWYGTVVLPSAMGGEVVYNQGLDPAIRGSILKTPGDVRNFTRPDPEKDGLMPRVLETIRYFRKHSDLPISHTDPQGPFTTALTLAGPENLFAWLYTNPEEVHQLMEFCTELFIDWIRTQKKAIGDVAGKNCFPHGIILPEEFGQVWLSDDDCVAISAKHYREFVVPYNAKIFRTFNGGTLHYCGSAAHQAENFLATDGLTGINNFCMGDFQQVFQMQEKFQNRISMAVCDFNPQELLEYYSELSSGLKTKGTILGAYIAPEFALHKGKYNAISRDGNDVAKRTYKIIQDLF